MKVLIVCAHFDANSFNASLLEAAIETLTSQGHEVRISDLYAMDFDPVTRPTDFSAPEKPEHIRYDTEQRHAVRGGTLPDDVKTEIDKLLWCDALILQFPWYWFGLPAIMKGWVDKVFAMGAIYGDGQWYNSGVMKGRRAMLAFSTGCFPTMCGPDGINGDMDVILWPIQNGILRFTGFDVLQPHVSYSVNYKTREQREQMIHDYAARLRGLFDDTPMAFNERADFTKDWRLKPGVPAKAAGQIKTTLNARSSD